MKSLFEKLRDDAQKWQEEGYPCEDFPLIGEVLRWQFVEEPQAKGALKYLRQPQFQALELYWYLRLVRKTPHIVALYKHYYSDDNRDFFEAFGIPMSPDELQWIQSVDAVIEKVKNDLGFVNQKRIHPVHEAVTLPYPSYIFALAMGTGKTVLIGAIIATEFAMALRYPDGGFMKNALVFAPGTTIIESLREISEAPYERILPPGLLRDFLANLKVAYLQSGAKELQVVRGSTYNIIVTNTEKISLRAKVRRHKNQTAFAFEEKKEQATLEANLRLQKIASLPSLGIFSDEAHHTYGNRMDAELKRVRETVNYINENTGLIAVVNTTGTPYYKRQMLCEVVAWYSLGEGIEDNILKSLRRGIVHYDIGAGSDAVVIRDILCLFFEHYGDVTLPNGAQAKIAFYFKTQAHLDASRIEIEKALAEIGQSPALILVNTQRSSAGEIAQFNRLNTSGNQKRIILLIGKGVEGWNCPSLFACALIKEQTTSSNFVLQAATRCLRQVAGNPHPAKIFLDTKNRRILDKELQENFGTTLGRLSAHTAATEEIMLRIRKPELPELEISRWVRRIVRTGQGAVSIRLTVPTETEDVPPIFRSLLTPSFTADGGTSPLAGTAEIAKVAVVTQTTGCYTVARRIAANYHLPYLQTLKMLRLLYPKGEVPHAHLYPLFQQVERQLQSYKVVEEEVREVIALIRTHDEEGTPLFQETDADGYYIHRLRLLKRTAERMRENHLLFGEAELPDEHGVSLHYTPYNFDSAPERDFFETILTSLNESVADVALFLFTGGLTDAKKTDFHFEYKGTDGNYHRYFPDFVIVKKTGEFFIVEIKAESERTDETVQAKIKAVERLEKSQATGRTTAPQFKYHVIYTATADIREKLDALKPVTDWIRNADTAPIRYYLPYTGDNTVRKPLV